MSAKVYFDGSDLHDAAKGYFNNIKEALKPEKFYVQAPTPQLLRKAQKAAVDLHRPIPRDAQNRILPHPSRGHKSDIFKKEDFKEVDSHALDAPISLVTANIEELVNYLVSPYENDDVSAVRSIFRWISGQDLRNYENIPEASSNSAAYFLNGLKNGRGRYDKIFNLMCEHARIPSASISGHSKGIGYNVGDPLTPSTLNIWNAVLLDNDWYLIDVHWASRKVSGVEADEWQVIEFSRRQPEGKTTPHDIYEFDEFYFLTNPEEFIYSHFPDQEVWQLLARPLTHAEFLKVIHLKPTFFRFGLKVKSHPWCTLKSVDGAVNIELTTEREDLTFSYELYRSTKVDSGQQRLDQYLFLERSPEEKKVCIEIRFPTTGKFKAEIYGRDAKSKLEWLCSYVLYCEKPEANCQPLPTNMRSEWGPGVDLTNAGIIPLTHNRGKIFMDGIETQVKFKLKLDVDLIAQLTTVDGERLDRYVLLGVMDNIATVNMRIPKKGQYSLCIFAKTDPYQRQLVNICNYLVQSSVDFGEVEPYPQTMNSRVGPLETFHKLGLKMTDDLPGFMTIQRDGQLNFSLIVPDGIDYFSRMTLSTDEDFSDYVGWYREDTDVHFNLRFSKAGFYKFSLFAKSEDDEGGYPEVLCLVLEVPRPMTNCLPFPKKFTAYKDTYQIISPNERLLAIGETENVEVLLPDAKEVALIENTSWTHLELKEDGIWQGQITPEGEAETISLAIKTESGGNYSAILSYEVILEKDLNRIFLAQKLAREEAEQEYLERMSIQNNASKKSQGDSMINQIQRIARMKQQNLDDETLQEIQSRVDDDDFEIHPVNGEESDDAPDDFENRIGYDNTGFTDSYTDYENDNSNDQLTDGDVEDTDEDRDYDIDDESQNLIPNVDINLNDIGKDDKMNESGFESQIQLEVNPENMILTNEKPFIRISNPTLGEYGEVSIENIPLRIGCVKKDDNFGESILEPQYIKSEQSLLEGAVHPDKNLSYVPIRADSYCESDSGNSGNESDSELSESVKYRKIDEVSAMDTKPEYMHLYNAAPPPPPAPSNSNLKPRIDEVSAMDIKPAQMHLYNAAPPPPARPNSELQQSLPRIDEVSAMDVKPEDMHLYNAAPPPPPSPGGDFTERLIKKVAEMEKSVEKEEMALENFSYQELKGMEENVTVLRQRPPQAEPVINQAAASTSVGEDKPTSVVRPFAGTDEKKNEEVPLIKFVEYFIYFLSLLSLLLYIHRILTWRPY